MTLSVTDSGVTIGTGGPSTFPTANRRKLAPPAEQPVPGRFEAVPRDLHRLAAHRRAI